MGQIKHLSPLLTCTQCALWELVLYVLFHRWEWVISLRNVQERIGREFENLYPREPNISQKSQNRYFRNYHLENPL